MRFRNSAAILSLPNHHFVVGIMPQPTRAERWEAVKERASRSRADLLVMAAIVATITLYQLLFLIHPLAGVYGAVVALASLVILAISIERYRNLAIGAAILPLGTMVMLSLPQSTPLAQSSVFYAVLLLLGLTYRYLFQNDQPEATKIGWRAYAYGIPFMFVLGELLAGVAYSLLRNDYPFEGSAAALVGVSVVVFAFAEEVVFRGLIQQRASMLAHPAVAAVLSAGLYAAMSISTGSWQAFLYALLAGGLLSTVYYYKRSLVLTTVLNAATKLVLLGLLATYVY